MFSKKRLFIAVAITFFIVMFVFISTHLHAFSCTGSSSCGSCSVSGCSTGGCVSSGIGYGCICDGLVIAKQCEMPVF